MPEGFQGTDRFQLLDRVGAGGSGLVYLAHDRKHKVEVALKTLHRESPYGILRLKNEFRSLAEVAHPNLAKLHDLHHEANTWFFTMEYIQGVDFIDWVRPGMDPTGQAALDMSRLRSALEQLVLGVSAIHMAGHLHRDIKPSNLMVEGDGRVVILDFGLATRFDQIDIRDIRGFSGTLEYMAPEQTDGGDPLPASDWYSVGVVLYQALTGQLPFQGKPLQVAINKKQNDGPSPSLINPNVPPDLNELCEGLLRCAPGQRFEDDEIFAILGIEPDESIMLQRGSSSLSTMPRLIGRESHMGALVSALGEVSNGRTVLCSVHGQSGMGKSALVRYFIYPLKKRPDTLIIRGRCYEREVVPYNAFDSVFDDLTRQLAAMPSDDVASLIPKNIAALTRLFPVLLNVPEISVAVSAHSAIQEALTSRQAAFEAARSLLSRIAERWLLVVHIDDVHWGDPDSASLLTELLNLVGAPKALFLCSFHTEEMHGGAFVRPLRFLVSRSSENFVGREIEVGPIDDSQGRTLARHLLDGRQCSERYIDQIVRESAGSPYFIESLVSHITDESAPTEPTRILRTGSLTLSAVIGARLEQLAPEPLRLLQVIVVAGRPIARPVALEVCGFGALGERALGLLRAEHLVRVRVVDDGEYFETYHDRVRDVVNGSLSKALTSHLNRAIALSLERRSQDAPESFVDHFIQAGELDRARQYLTESAGRAENKLAFERAAGLYGQALEVHRQSITLPASDPALEEERELLVSLAEALENSGRAHQSAKMYLEASTGASDERRRELQARSASNLMISGSVRQGVTILKRVLQELDIPYSSSAAASLPVLQQLRQTLADRGTEFSLNDTGLTAALREKIDVCWTAAIGLGTVDYVRAAEFQARSLLASLDSGDAYRIARSLAMESINAAAKAPKTMNRAETLSAAAHVLATQIDHPHAIGLSLYGRGVCYLLAGQWSKARETLEDAAQLFRERCQRANWERATTHTMIFSAMAMQGDFRVLLSRVPELLEEARSHQNAYFATNLRTGYAGLTYLAADDVESAERLHEQSARLLRDESFQLQHYFVLMSQVHLGLYKRDALSALNEVMAVWPRAQAAMIDQVNFVRLDLLSLRIRAAFASLIGGREVARARGLIDRDLALMADSETPWAIAQADLFKARLAEIDGARGESIKLYKHAIAGLEEAGTLGWASAARISLGELLGGDEGETLVDLGVQLMQDNGVRNPKAMTRIYIPRSP